MANSKIITGLDLGSGTIKIAVGQAYQDELEIIAVIEHPSEGINKGVIVDVEEVVSSLSASFEKAERTIGFPINSVNVGISGTNVLSQESRGVVAISRAEGEIKREDVRRALDAAQTIATPPNYEILHVIPKIFKVDNQIGIKDPVGMTGVRLEVEAQIILDLSRQIKNLVYCLHRTGLEIERTIFSALATAETILDKKQKDLGVAVLDIGESTTHLIVYEEGDILTVKILPIGSRDITSSIAIALRSSISVAEMIKVNFGTSDYRKVKKNEQIDLKKFDEGLEGQFTQQFLAKIIHEKCQEIFKMADKELATISKSRKLPAGVILVGGGSKLLGLVETAKDALKLPIFLGKAKGFSSELKEALDPKFATAIGLIILAKEEKDHFGASIRDGRGIFSIIKKWFKNLLPY
ncbi:cell division protein FtsA [bacterium (Candidatus Moisslbacteria) CG12_big_fil_rev_8_21_14_0_65_36_11]|nr:cell division protein FtsA [Candidatus Kuenenbacteria bacterium]OIP76551.1 MAG: cell division protein FtsA [Parcubacteria group bacterium CG2_30_36_38]PIV46197.1 MAG: cell division protein FtsA [bacterium (Candidatus Moisslbacteria) CG02_land_8_20_14_3_00_36_53]PIW67960.1 MAG: cell division protein FtsA [bacterium (Candidatus Moisslbacteria) CG12_big_fil_rev_8_21_14_0_65_36_11]PIZ90208.1 MAG: cell division protein FtsA [bacterium (Candidatus Moisslbacteria) CG_4_10_14_0_2_um_filter_36_61]PJ